MLDKLTLKFCFVSYLPKDEAERDRIEKYFNSQRGARLEVFTENIPEGPCTTVVGDNGAVEVKGADNLALIKTAKWFIETSETIVSIHSDPTQTLLELKVHRLELLRTIIDELEAELLHNDPGSISGKNRFLFSKRFEYLRAQLQHWEEALNAGAFTIAQLRPLPNFEAKFPQLSEQTPWNPAAEKAKEEPEEFRQIWLNPDEDIPFVLETLKRLGFIDENEVWRWNTDEDNPRGVIDAIEEKSNLFSDFSGEHRARVFAKRFKFPDPTKRFEKKGNYSRAKNKMSNYLKNNK